MKSWAVFYTIYLLIRFKFNLDKCHVYLDAALEKEKEKQRALIISRNIGEQK